ncbi:DNA/RNA polymerase [Durotheca rogersii]|uniref:DNA/RNA polymerase n=1 Tax=Durotheca rogersii TaxID=419775 RepID=UPI00221E5084|nr:DNA/RNA polymerase [Durotheca rogersii]KAI5859700.1 DNA/RNA polymerase [Durotheca rogersii]
MSHIEPVVPETVESKDDDRQQNTLKYHLLGPSLTKAGQDSVDQVKVSEIIYNASKGSKYFNREEVRDKVLTQKIEQILQKKRHLEVLDLTRELRAADQFIAQLDASRDLTQYLVHVDCDAFYAAVEQLDRPELEDLPFAVGDGVLTTCNYVARTFGCRSGMAAFVAKRLCPNLLLIPPNFDKYAAKAREVRKVFVRYDPRFESASIDEAYLNITEYCTERDIAPERAVQQMRDEIYSETKITVSAGIAANTRLAKICSNINKPNGQFALANDRNAIMAFMRKLPTRKVNGVGRVLERELQEIGINTCGDINTHRHLLMNRRPLFGDKTYEFLVTSYLGLGRTEVQPVEEYERKSVGTENTFQETADPTHLREKLRLAAEELEKDLRRAECKGRTLVLKVKLDTFEVLTRQVVMPRAIYAAEDLYSCSLPILAKLEQDIPGMKLRLMGLRCTHLVSTKKPDPRAFFGPRPVRAASGDKMPDNLLTGPITPGHTIQARTPERVLVDDGQDDASSPKVERLQTTERDDTPNTFKETSVQQPAEWWDCPICCLPQLTDERLFNNHIDTCLSRQTIRDAIQRDYAYNPASPSRAEPPPKRLKNGERRKGRTGRPNDPKQKKLAFT